VYVGLVDQHRSLLQHNTRLFLVNHTQLARELFYQQVMRLFGCAPAVAVKPNVNVFDCLMLALRGRAPLTKAIAQRGTGAASAVGGGSQPPWKLRFEGLGKPAAAEEEVEEDGEEEDLQIASEASLLLLSKAAMLKEYFSIGFTSALPSSSTSSDGDGGEHQDPRAVHLTHLPRLLDHYRPLMTRLPDFLLSLAYDVCWTEEKACFRSVAQVIANFFAEQPPAVPPMRAGDVVDNTANNGSSSGGDGAAGAPSSSSSSAADAGAGAEDADDDLLQDKEGDKADEEEAAGGKQGQAAGVGAKAATQRHPYDLGYRSDPSSIYFRVGSILFPAFRVGLVPPRKLAQEHHVVQLACTEQLYRIFERC
jgi:DNA mismatch repair protein MLH1